MATSEDNSAILFLWVPVVVAAHVFAGFWLLRTLVLYDPRLLDIFKRRRIASPGTTKRGPSAGRHSRDGSEQDVVLTVDRAVLKRNSAASGSSSDRSDRDSCARSSRLSRDSYESLAQPDTAEVYKVEQVHLEWQQLSCAYNSAGRKIVVLHDVWGKAAPGEMQALLGPSGAGKSTLMDILAQRKSLGTLSGFLLVNGRPATSSFVRRTAYVPQDDNFVATMTTNETMTFYASIILPGSFTKADRAARVAEVLAAMGLSHKTEIIVGGTLPGGLMLRGLSGGERKRLSIAAGILSTPNVVFLDEPTSGLDSFAALTVMGYLKRMAQQNGHAIIASIHQPRSAIWSMFDKVTLLASGRLMFHGACADLVPWFGHLGYKYDPTLHGVASDWALDLVAIGFHKPKRFYGHTITSFSELTRASCEFASSLTKLSGMEPFDGDSSSMIGTKSLGQKVQARMNKLVGIQSNIADSSSLAASTAAVMQSEAAAALSQDPTATTTGTAQISPKQSKWASSWWRQFASCYERELLSITRNPTDVAGRTMTFAWVAILMGLLYYGMPTDATSIRGRLNMTFNILTFFCLMPYVSMSLYSADKKFYIADASARLYRPHAYYAAKVAATTPFQVMSSLVFCFTVYGMAGLRPGAKFIWQNGAISTLLSLISVQVLHCCAILAPNQDVAFMLSIVWTSIQLLMSNFFITFTEIVFQWLTVLRWLSALYYAFEGLAVTEFSGLTFRCDAGLDQAALKLLRTLLPNSSFLNMHVVVNGLQNPGPDCVADANAVLEYYNFGRPFAHSFGILLGYLLSTHLCTYICMVVVARRERR